MLATLWFSALTPGKRRSGNGTKPKECYAESDNSIWLPSCGGSLSLGARSSRTDWSIWNRYLFS